MKNKIVVLITAVLTIIGLAVAYMVAHARQELAIRKDVWGKLRELSILYPEGLRLTVPEKEGVRTIIVRNEDWSAGIKFEFGMDGLTARRLDLGNEVGWSYLIK